MTQLIKIVKKGDDRIDWKNKIIPFVKEELPKYYAKDYKPTNRTMFYRLFSLGMIPNTAAVNKGFTRALSTAKKNGVIAYDAFADTSRNIIEDYPLHSDAHVVMYDFLYKAKKASKNFLDEYYYKWSGQPKYVEVWIEKEALASAFKSMIYDLHVTIVPFKGYISDPFLVDAMKRLLSAIWSEKEVHVLYFGDFDPSGLHIHEAVKEKFELIAKNKDLNISFEDINFERVALTEEQIKKYNLPKDLSEETMDKLKQDKRGEEFQKKYGELFQVELDAMDALHEEEFEEIIRDAVLKYYDEGINTQNIEKHNKADHKAELLFRLRQAIKIIEEEDNDERKKKTDA